MTKLPVLVFLGCVLTQSAALAQAPEAAAAGDVDRARSLFREGVDQAESSDFAAAALSFEAALALHDAPSIRFNLASALLELDRFIEAHGHLRAILDDDGVDAAMSRNSEELLARVVQQIGRLRVRASESLDRVTLDGALVERDQETAVEPGRHVVVGSQNEQVVVERSVEVAAGERATVDLTVLRVDADGELAGESSSLVGPPPSRVGRSVTIVVAAVVLVATAVILGVVLSGGEDEVQGDLQPGVLRW